MDTFIEQIVAIKKTGKTWFYYILIALAAITLMTAVFMIPYLKTFFVVIDAFILYGVYKLYSLLSVEYEYIITNSTMDIDKIVAKSSRKRILSFDLSSVQRIEKHNGKAPNNASKNLMYFCNKNDEDAYLLFYKEEGKPEKVFVFAPNERTREAMKGFLPRHLGSNL